MKGDGGPAQRSPGAAILILSGWKPYFFFPDFLADFLGADLVFFFADTDFHLRSICG